MARGVVMRRGGITALRVRSVARTPQCLLAAGTKRGQCGLYTTCGVAGRDGSWRECWE